MCGGKCATTKIQQNKVQLEKKRENEDNEKIDGNQNPNLAQ